MFELSCCNDVILMFVSINFQKKCIELRWNWKIGKLQQETVFFFCKPGLLLMRLFQFYYQTKRMIWDLLGNKMSFHWNCLTMLKNLGNHILYDCYQWLRRWKNCINAISRCPAVQRTRLKCYNLWNYYTTLKNSA